MKQWKEDLAQAIVAEWSSENTVNFPPVGETDRAVKFSSVAQAHSYNHIDRGDIRDIAIKVGRLAPQLKAGRVVADPAHIPATESAWNTLYFTDLELDAD